MKGFVIAGITVSGFFIFFILSKKNRKRADYLLALINLLMIGFLLLNMLIEEKLTLMLFFIQALLPYYLFPIFLFFVLEILGKEINSKWLLIFIPALLTTLYVAWDLYFSGQNYKGETLIKLYNYPPISYHVLYKGNQLMFVLALLWLIKKLNAYAKDIKNNFSFIDPIQLAWLARFSRVYLIIICVTLFSFLASNLGLLPITIQTAYTITSASLIIAIFYLSFHGIRQYSVAEYYGKKQPDMPMPLDKETIDLKEKYKGSSLTATEQEQTYTRLLTIFQEQALYCKPKLQLQDVADDLQVSAHALSQTINSKAGKPFYDLVNSYRVQHLQKLLEDPAQKRFTILALGLDSGFNSKASLNRVFKEHTGLSPSEYQKTHFSN